MWYDQLYMRGGSENEGKKRKPQAGKNMQMREDQLEVRDSKQEDTRQQGGN